MHIHCTYTVHTVMHILSMQSFDLQSNDSKAFHHSHISCAVKFSACYTPLSSPLPPPSPPRVSLILLLFQVLMIEAFPLLGRDEGVMRKGTSRTNGCLQSKCFTWQRNREVTTTSLASTDPMHVVIGNLENVT